MYSQHDRSLRSKMIVTIKSSTSPKHYTPGVDDAAFGRTKSFPPLNLSRHLAKPRRKNDARSGDKMNKVSRPIIDCGEFLSAEVSKRNHLMARISAMKSSLTSNTMRRSCCPPSGHCTASTTATTTSFPFSTCDVDSTTTTVATSSSSSEGHVPQQYYKRVTFLEQAEVYDTISLENFSIEERAMAWYSPEEFEDITNCCCKLILKMNRGGGRLKSKHEYTRGLETHTHIRSLFRQKNRSDAIQAVLAEQSRQLRQGINEIEEIAHIYHDASASSQLWANIVGLQDQREAERVTEDDLEELFFNVPSSASLLSSGNEEVYRGSSLAIATSNTAPPSPRRCLAIESARAA